MSIIRSIACLIAWSITCKISRIRDPAGQGTGVALPIKTVLSLTIVSPQADAAKITTVNSGRNQSLGIAVLGAIARDSPVSRQSLAELKLGPPG